MSSHDVIRAAAAWKPGEVPHTALVAPLSVRSSDGVFLMGAMFLFFGVPNHEPIYLLSEKERDMENDFVILNSKKFFRADWRTVVAHSLSCLFIGRGNLTKSSWWFSQSVSSS